MENLKSPVSFQNAEPAFHCYVRFVETPSYDTYTKGNAPTLLGYIYVKLLLQADTRKTVFQIKKSGLFSP
jgi:hypothetical protein